MRDLLVSLRHETRRRVNGLEITFTGNPQKDAALLHVAEELHILVRVAPDAKISSKIHNAELKFAGARNGTDTSMIETGVISVGMIKHQPGGSACEC